MTVEGFDQQNAAERPAKERRTLCKTCRSRRIQSLIVIGTAVLCVVTGALNIALGERISEEEHILGYLIAAMSVPIFAIGWDEWRSVRRGCGLR